MTTFAVIAAIVVALVAGGVAACIYVLRRIEAAGGAAERAARAEADLAATKRQTEIMLGADDAESVADDLDRGEF